MLNAGNSYSDFVEHCAFVEHSDANERLLLFPVQPLDRLELLGKHLDHSEEQ